MGGCLCASVCREPELTVEVEVTQLRLALARARLAENFAVRRGIFDAQPPLADPGTQTSVSSWPPAPLCARLQPTISNRQRRLPIQQRALELRRLAALPHLRTMHHA